jgi:phage baseplate assembly protein V
MSYNADIDIGRNVLRRVEVIEVDDSGPIQKVTVKGLADEIFELPLRGQPHGLTGVPKKGAIGYVMMANGRPDQAFLMGIEHEEDRPKEREPGESTMYATPGQQVHMDKNGNVVITSAGGGTVHINPT